MARPAPIKTQEDFTVALAASLRAAKREIKVFNYKPHYKQSLFHGSASKGRLFIGGNRSGKTVGGACEVVWWLTGTHPYRVCPRPPVRLRGVAVDIERGIDKIMLPEIKRWMPLSELKGESWETGYDNANHTLTLKNGSFIEFLTYMQDTNAHAGTSRHAVWFDEEPPKAIFDENMQRLVDTDGEWWLTMTPLDGMCVDEQTEVLTSRGFLKWYQLRSDEQLLTYNLKGFTEWQPILDLYVNQNYAENMYKFDTLDAVCTLDHKWVVKGVKKKAYTLLTTDRITVAAPYSGIGLGLSENFWYVLGFVIGDGTLPKDHSRVVVYQNTGPKLDKFLDKLSALGITYINHPGRTKQNRQIHFYCDTIRKYITAWKMPRFNWLTQISSEEAKSIVEGIVDSDGSKRKSGSVEITQKESVVADFIATLCVLTGKRTTCAYYENYGYKIRIFNTESRYDSSRITPGRSQIAFSGTVWCPSVANGTVVMRRGKDIYITSNTWVFDHIYSEDLENPSEDVFVVEVAQDENPHINQEAALRLSKTLTEEQRKARKSGLFVATGGLIYGSHFTAANIIDPVTIDQEFRRHLWVASMDHGYANPTCWLWAAVNRQGEIIIFDEHYESEQLVIYHANEVKRRNHAYEKTPEYYCGDPAISQRNGINGESVHSEYAKLDIPIALANNNQLLGINRCLEYIIGVKDRPKLYIAKNCVNLIQEIKRLRWAVYAQRSVREDKNRKEEQHKKNDHACDAMRYLVMSRPDYDDGTLTMEGAPLNIAGVSYQSASPFGERHDWEMQSTFKPQSDFNLGDDY